MDNTVSLSQTLYAALHRIPLHTQQLSSCQDQLFLRKKGMSGREIIGQFKQNTGLHPAGIVTGNTHFNGKPVHRAKGRVKTVIHQQIGIVIKKIHSLLSIQFVSTDSQFRRKMMNREELHQLPQPHLTSELGTKGSGLLQRDPGNLGKPFRLPLHDQKGLVPKMLHNTGSHNRADPLDGPAGKIALNLNCRLRQDPFQELRLKLTAEIGVIAPFSGHHEPLAYNRHGNRSNHRYVLIAAHRQSEDGVSVVIILIHHGADGAL